MWCASDNHNYICHISAKEFLDSKFDKAVVNKMSDVDEIASNFTYWKEIVIFKVYLKRDRPTAPTL